MPEQARALVKCDERGPEVTWNFPTDRLEKRQALLDAVESVRAVVLSCADDAEEQATLPQASVDALEQAGLFALKLPTEFGGAEADPVTQIEVIEAMVMYDSAAAWGMMIGATNIALPAVMLPDEAVAQIFAGGNVPRAAGVGMPSGVAMPVNGGYVVSGRWRFASGIKHSQWLSAGVRVEDGMSGLSEIRRVVFPTEKARIADDWQVSGLKGTGSNGFTVGDLFVPEEFTWLMSDPPRRGGAIYLLGRSGFVANEHAAIALGLARRALNAIVELAQSKLRGSTSKTLIADRASFQRAIGESDLRLRAVRALVMETFESAWDVVCQGSAPDPQLQTQMRGCATLATDVAVEVTSMAFRYGGGEALYMGGELQRCHRDMDAAAQHIFVSDVVYENLGKFALGLPDVVDMTGDVR